jgi:hypothetical protein
MKRTLLALFTVGVSLLSSACSKHSCKLDSDGKKQAFSVLADMTAGAFSCDIEGNSEIAGQIDPTMQCTVGDKNCVASMHAIHAKTTVAEVAPRYKDFLGKHQWAVESEKKITGKFGNGKPYEGMQFVAKNGDNGLITRVVPFGDDMVETTTLLVPKPAK